MPLRNAIVGNSKQKRPAMLKNYIKIALGCLAKQKVYAAINVLGFAVGYSGLLAYSIVYKEPTPIRYFFPQW
jgi:uncharacterized alpha/beta hydrolase family protein